MPSEVLSCALKLTTTRLIEDSPLLCMAAPTPLHRPISKALMLGTSSRAGLNANLADTHRARSYQNFTEEPPHKSMPIKYYAYVFDLTTLRHCWYPQLDSAVVLHLAWHRTKETVEITIAPPPPLCLPLMLPCHATQPTQQCLLAWPLAPCKTGPLWFHVAPIATNCCPSCNPKDRRCTPHDRCATQGHLSGSRCHPTTTKYRQSATHGYHEAQARGTPDRPSPRTMPNQPPPPWIGLPLTPL